MGRLQDKVVIITGAAMGQGETEAKLFAAEGAKVVATDLQEEQLNRVVDEIRGAGGQALGLKHNVASEEDWKRVVEKAVEQFGKVDVLVNNAGISTDSTLDTFTMENWDKVMSINLTGCVIGMKYVVPEMRKAGGGSIVNISSIAGIVALNFTNGYTAAKGALRSLSKASAVELAPDKIRVNSVHPGIIVTPMIQEALDQGAGHMFETGTPLPRLGKPEDIAYGVLYLASDESSFVTGTELIIDGGWTAR
ncbi:glucose 1-dehydrogenase [Paenibacillus sp. UNC499MF]|uniref:glucose 1-dehydrogenase n=1 Tax=Paenibacillus sp. UNC499MF TaxID=1502751 RepID=UPI00089F8B97|nr:glucose 1-dehydrogenase [Paenibacillus sp. UNC499MF]SEG70652.1 NAD(P)-dependent dehydrogenase, short-chain alcohol dehydrogenase family [Paenibacillus sp. UNC499MF]